MIGSEITHGFDTKKNNLLNLEILRNGGNSLFKNKTQCMIDQYSSYVLEEIKLKSDRKLTLAENMADNCGLKQAFRVLFNLILVNLISFV